jgi:serine/threonine-protein kinase
VATLTSGQTIGGYRIDRLVGRGGMGEVYRATQLSLDRPVALKLIAPELARDEDFAERFRSEARAAARLRHENILPVYETGEQDGVLYLSMAFVEGQDLASILREGPLEPDRAAEIVAQVAAALDAAHAAGLVHRDVKPANVLVERRNGHEHAYLSDFGLAKSADASQAGPTRTGTFVGTVNYVAPEQITKGQADARSDVYSLGCLLYESLTGDTPFRRDTDMATLWAHVNDETPSVTAGLATAPGDFDDVLRRALAKDPDERYPSAGDLGRAALAAAHGETLPEHGRSVARGAALHGVTGRRARKRRSGRRAALIAVPIVLGAGIAVGILAATGVFSSDPAETTVAPAPPASPSAGEPVAAEPVQVEENSVVGIDPASGEVEQALPLGSRPSLVAAGESGVWTADADARTVSQVGVDGGAARTISAGGVPTGLAVGLDAVWVAAGYADTVTRIDPSTGAVTHEIDVPGGPTGLAIGDGSLWVANIVSGTVVRINPTSNAVTDTIEIGEEPSAIAFGEGSLWVASKLGRTIARVDPATGEIVTRIGLRFAPGAIAAGAGGVWVTHPADDSVSRIDPATDAVGTSIAVEGGPVGVATGEDAVWVAAADAGTVVKIDPSSGAVASTTELGVAASGVALTAETVWASVVSAEPPTTAAPGAASLAEGGTLRVTALGSYEGSLDPQWFPTFQTSAIDRCCLVRSLLTFNGRPAGEGGTRPTPDLAVALPEASDDGRTWTFTLQEGIRYAPPFDDREIVAGDVVYALERMLRPKPAETLENPFGAQLVAFGSYEPYYRIIEGAREFTAGEADTIAGLETPDDHTLVVHLTESTGDILPLFAMPVTAPIPEGAADGHDLDYERFQVASGPYMIEGSEALDFSRPPGEQQPVSGFVPGESVTLVRNPSWDRETDGVRGAYVDRIEIEYLPEPQSQAEAEQQAADLQSAVETGAIDLVLDNGGTRTTHEIVNRYRNDPELEGRMLVTPDEGIEMLMFNLAQPPFDDVHVRRAVNLVVDKARILELCCVAATAANHHVIDSLVGNLLADYAPYATEGDRGDLEAAKEEMRLSRYDTDGDGVCDAEACKNVRHLSNDFLPPELVRISELPDLGIQEKLVQLPFDEYLVAAADPSRKFALTTTQWGLAAPLASDYFRGLFHSDAIANPETASGHSLLGAAPEQLEGWGYDVTSVPSLDAKIDDCIRLAGPPQTQCWAEATRVLGEEVIPAVPFITQRSARFVSGRVESWTTDGVFVTHALDQISLKAAEID